MSIFYSLLPAARFDNRYSIGPVTFDDISRLRPEELEVPEDLARYSELARRVTCTGGQAPRGMGAMLMTREAYDRSNRQEVARFAGMQSLLLP